VLTAAQAGEGKGWQSRACLARLLVVDSLSDQTLGERSENQARRRQAVRAGSVGWSAMSELVYPLNHHWGRGIVPPCCRESHRWTLLSAFRCRHKHNWKPQTWTADKCKQSVCPAPLLANVMYINLDCLTQTGTQSHTKTNYDLYTLETYAFIFKNAWNIQNQFAEYFIIFAILTALTVADLAGSNWEKPSWFTAGIFAQMV